MINFFIGIIVSLAIIVFLEVIKTFNRKLVGALTLTGIAYIYLGFVWFNKPELFVVSIVVLAFMLLSYLGITKDFKFIVIGLILHGLWDLIFTNFSKSVPKGYDIFCMTVDFILAVYFYIRFSAENKIIKNNID